MDITKSHHRKVLKSLTTNYTKSILSRILFTSIYFTLFLKKGISLFIQLTNC